MRELTYDEAVKILIDPWEAIIVDSLSDHTFIGSQGNEWELKEEVFIPLKVWQTIKEWVDSDIIYYSDYSLPEEQRRVVATPHFLDIWREDAYGQQPYKAKEQAKKLGLDF